MVNPECLDPKEVLAHLNSMGYCDITPQQLKDFIHDLTKLIKYEQKQASRSRVAGNTTKAKSPVRESSPEYSESLGKSHDESYSESSSDSNSTTATYSAEHKPSSGIPLETVYTPRYHTSFIRPWNLQGCKDNSSRGKKNLDPVRLYHQYNDFWKKYHIPGEYKHLELRWDIRNRMVGQEPTPRVCI